VGLVALLGSMLPAATAEAQDDGEPTSAEPAPGSSDGSTTDSDDTTSPDGEEPKREETKSASEDDSENTTKSASAQVKLEASPVAPAPFARFWIGVAGSLDLAILAGSNDGCLLTAAAKPASSPGTFCTTPGGSDFPSRANLQQNASLVPGRSGKLDNGLQLGDVRVLVTADYAITESILAGVRIGYVLNTYPGDAAISGRPAFLRNLHLEARGTYLFARDALTHVTFAPMAFVGAGVATSDAHTHTSVSMNGIRGKTPVDAWQVGGLGLLVAGGGVRYGFSSRSAFTAAWKLELAFGTPSTLFAMGPELGFQWGF
jgi:hypothetical protein